MSPAARQPRSRTQRQRTEDKPPARERAAAAENRTDSIVDEYVTETTCLEPIDDDVPGRPPVLDQDFTRADQEDIEACADWSYIHYFECAFEAMQVLSAGFQDGRFPLECQVAVRMDVWIHQSFKRVPATQRQAMGASVLDGVEQMLDDLYDALLAIYEARVGCCDDKQTPPGPVATLAWTIERFQRELSRRGAGAPAFIALRVGRELMDAFKILGSPDLARFLCPGYDIDLVGNIDRLLGDRKPDGSPRMPAYQLAELAVNSRLAIEQVAALVDANLLELAMGEIDGLTAQLALLRAVAGRRDFEGRRDFDGKRERLTDDAAQTAAKVIQLTRTAGSPF